MEQPSIEIFGLILQEPVTTITDIMITIVCWWAAVKLRRDHSPHGKTQQYMEYFLWFMGLSTLLGGLLAHGFYDTPLGSKLPGWAFSLVSVVFLCLASISAYKKLKPTSAQVLQIIVLLSFIIFLVLYLRSGYNMVGTLYAALSLLGIVLPLHILSYRATKNKGSYLIFFFILLNVLPAILLITKLSISPWFNHNDISHIFMMTSNYVAYKAATLF